MLDIAGIAPMRIGKNLAQAVFIGGNCDEVDMIGHETVAPDFCSGVKRRFAWKIKVQRIVPFFKKDSTAPVSTLGNMVGSVGDNDPR